MTVYTGAFSSYLGSVTVEGATAFTENTAEYGGEKKNNRLSAPSTL